MAQKILVVEDDALTRTNLCQALQIGGYQVTEARDGNQAVELLDERPFDLVVADFVLPKLHGFYLVDLIHSKWPQIPLVVISGYLSKTAAEVLFADSAKFIAKPVEAEVLLSTVERLLGSNIASPATYRKRTDS
jgi:DNA-binding NtrC family response regulator